MRPEIALAGMLPHPPNLGAVGRALHAGPYSKIEVAGALAGLPAHVVQLIEVKWLDDAAGLHRLNNYTVQYIADIARQKGWVTERGWVLQTRAKKEPLRNLTRIAINDCIGSPACDQCEGRKWLYPIDEAPQECPKCIGTGVSAPSGRTLAAQFGVDESSWRAYWGKRYRVVVATLYGWESLGLSHVAEKLDLW